MRALRFYGAKDLRVEDIAEPDAGPGQIKIKVDWCGICGSDLHEYLLGPLFIPTEESPHPLTGDSLPVTMGHEFAGRVVALGDGVTSHKVGQAVAVEANLSCGTCLSCRRGDYNLCSVGGFYGLSGWSGGLAEYAVVDAHKAFVVPEHVGTDIGALVEPLSIAWQAMRVSGYSPGDAALIVGAGPIGLALLVVLKASGARWVGLSEIADARKQMALEMGADAVFDASRHDVGAKAKEATDGIGPDVVFDASGLDITMATAIEAVRIKGTVTNVAIWEQNLNVDLNAMVMGGKTLATTIGYANVHEAVIAALADGRINAKPMITRRVPLERAVEEGFETLIAQKDKHIKILIHP